MVVSDHQEGAAVKESQTQDNLWSRKESLIEYLLSAHFDVELDLERDSDSGRDIIL
ncbi:hypothetical protein [Arthrobacter monumenti]